MILKRGLEDPSSNFKDKTQENVFSQIAMKLKIKGHRANRIPFLH